ncbi:MAG: amino acid adenylation domain-containing protein [Verrucomicrobia bacterium]|nr:amino acid adenylation domain-containing protein [Verrucomicrobiota bacterium]
MNASQEKLYQSTADSRRALLAQLLRQTAEREELVPLSYAQQRLWFLDQLEPDRCLYNLPLALRLLGPLDVRALRQALQEIVNRHESLRTSFAANGECPSQVIARRHTLSVPLTEVNNEAGLDREAEVNRRIARASREPFDLSRGPLLRAELLRLNRQDHVLILTLHHIVCDAWSMDVLLRELAVLYQAFATDQPSPLPDLPIQYADFALWQHQHHQDEVVAAQLAYWTRQLEGIPNILELPADHPRPVIQTYRGAHQPFVFDRALTKALMALGQTENATLFMVLLALFKTLLHRYTGQGDVVVGSPIANRNRREIEPLIGIFANTLVLRTRMHAGLRFRELLRQVRQVALEAYDRQDFPFEKLVERLQPERTLSHNPLFQVMFVLQNAWPENLALTGLDIQPMEVHTGTAKFDLTLAMRQDGRQSIGQIEYNTDIFEPPTIARLLGHFQTLAESAAADPGRRLADLSLLSPGERHPILIKWNQTRSELPTGRCLHQLFEAQAEKTPDAEAFVAQRTRLTYRELNQRANALAQRLRGLGVRPDVLVGLCVERSANMVVGMLGVLKAGGAYLPLDPMYPKARLAFALSDSQAKVLVTERNQLDRLPPHEARIVCLDTDDDACPAAGVQSVSGSTRALACSDRRPAGRNVGAVESPDDECFEHDRAAGDGADHDTRGRVRFPTQFGSDRSAASSEAQSPRPENLAYVIYTSGSTGQPKGVCVEHRNAVSLVEWARRTFEPAELQGVLASTSMCFDLSVFEVFVPLSCGGKVILAENLFQFPSLPAAGEVTLVNTVPSAMAELLRLDGVPGSVCAVILAGEPLSPKLVEEVHERTRAKRVLDLYGPTEDTVYSTGSVRSPGGPATIGRPLINKQAFILDAQLQPLPAGVPGELYLGGCGVARGYLNRPQLTAERFVPDPLNLTPGARLYRTGDLARFRSDGNIEFLGRRDHQIKLRGYRIELGEIEAAMRQHPRVRECAVAVAEMGTGEKSLVGYIVPRENLAIDSGSLRSFLAERLPAHMVPAAFVRLNALPRTANGKVDRRALPSPEPARQRATEKQAPPRTATERILAEIWKDVLGVTSIGVHDNFFELGGHSLIVTRLIARLRAAFEIDLAIRTIFEAPTIAALAGQIEKLILEEVNDLPLDEGQRSPAAELTRSKESA